jgi:hypothetical protein
VPFASFTAKLTISPMLPATGSTRSMRRSRWRHAERVERAHQRPQREASITKTGTNAYTFQASANPNLTRTKDPATVTLIIGNDTDTTTARF